KCMMEPRILGARTRAYKLRRNGSKTGAQSRPKELDPFRERTLACEVHGSAPLREDSLTLPASASQAAVRAARRFPWKLFLTLVVVAVFGSAGAVFGLVQWLGNDLPR